VGDHDDEVKKERPRVIGHRRLHGRLFEDFFSFLPLRLVQRSFCCVRDVCGRKFVVTGSGVRARRFHVTPLRPLRIGRRCTALL